MTVINNGVCIITPSNCYVRASALGALLACIGLASGVVMVIVQNFNQSIQAISGMLLIGIVSVLFVLLIMKYYLVVIWSGNALFNIVIDKDYIRIVNYTTRHEIRLKDILSIDVDCHDTDYAVIIRSRCSPSVRVGEHILESKEEALMFHKVLHEFAGVPINNTIE